MIIKTKRLLIRPPRMSDSGDLVENLNNLNISKWMTGIPYPYGKKDALLWIKKATKSWQKKKKESYPFGIALREEDKFIGIIGLHHVNPFRRSATVGYWLGEEYWRAGYGSEALEAIINFAFNKLKVKRLEASVFEGNPSSGRLLEKFGFKLEGKLRESSRSKANKKVYNELIYGLLKGDYRK